MSLDHNIKSIEKLIRSVTDFDYFSLIPPLYIDSNSEDDSFGINIYQTEKEPSMELWIESLKTNKQLLIIFHYPPDEELQTYCIDGIERPISSYELENGLSVSYMEESMAFFIAVSEKIEITPGIIGGYNGQPEFFTPNNLHPDILRAFSFMTENFFCFNYVKSPSKTW